jgi:hypothetical protein
MPIHWEDEYIAPWELPFYKKEEPLWMTAGLHRAPPDFPYEDEGIGGVGDLPSDLQIQGGPKTPDSTTVYGIKAPPGIEGYVDRYREAYEPPGYIDRYGEAYDWPSPFPPYNPIEEGYKPRFLFGEYPMTEMPLEGVENLPGGIAAYVLGTTYDETPSQEAIDKRRMGAIAYRATQTKKALRRIEHEKQMKELDERLEALRREREQYPLTPLGWQKAYSGTEIEEDPTRANPSLRRRENMRLLIERQRRKMFQPKP